MQDDEITELKFPDTVRQRPGMYLGSLDNASVVLRECSDNNLDQVLSNHATKLWIYMKNSNRRITKNDIQAKYYVTADNGSGIPIRPFIDRTRNPDGTISEQVTDMTQCYKAMSTVHAGSKFKKTTIQSGMNGVGESCFLSDTLVRVCNEDNEWYNIRIEDLAKEISEGKLRYVNCMTPTGPVKSRVKNCWETKKVKEYLSLEFELDSGLKLNIECTPEHLWQKSDGTYIEARDITEDTDLMESKLDFSLDEILSRSVNVYGDSIYRIYNIDTNKSYLGSFQDSLLARFIDSDWFGQSHATKIRTCDYHPLYQAIRKYGTSKFRVEILESSLRYEDCRDDMQFSIHEIRDKLRARESYFISKFNSAVDGYNITESGNFSGSGKASVLAAKFRGTGRFSSKFQKDRSSDALVKSFNRIYRLLQSENLDINEVNWKSKTIYSSEPSYRYVTRNIDWYINKKCLPEEDRSKFTEMNFDYNPYELLELNGVPHGASKQKYTKAARRYYKILDEYGEVTFDTFSRWFRTNKPDASNYKIQEQWEALLSTMDMCIKCKLISRDDVSEELLNEIN